MRTINYFPHDFFARNDAKLVKLRMEMGNKGIGIYWSIVEMLYEEGGKIELQNLNTVAFGINEEVTNVQQVVQQYDLFKSDEKYFWSESVSARLKNIKKVSRARSKAGKASAEKRTGNKSGTAPQNPDSQQDKTQLMDATFVYQMLNKCSTETQWSVETNSNNKNKIKIKIKEKEYILDKPKGYEFSSFEYVHPAILEALFEWLDYKKTRGEKYKDDKQLKICYNKIFKLSNGDSLKAKEIVEDCIANHYQGIYASQQKQGNYGNNTGNYSTVQQGQQERQADAVARINRLFGESDEEMERRQKAASGGLQSGSSERNLFE